MDTIKFAKIRPDAIIPSYGRKGDGCLDIFPCFDEESITIDAHDVALIPTGICATFPENYRINIRERGSNTKSCLQVMAGVCDSNYTGEYFVALYNANRVPVVLSKNVKELERGINYIFVPYNKAVAQLAIEYNPIVNIEEVNVEEITSLKTERGDGKLGSSGR